MSSNMPYHITEKFLSMIKKPSKTGKKLKYLFVLSRICETNDRLYQFPIGFSMVSSALKASGREVFTLNLNYKDNYLELLKKTIIDNQIDVVATGGLSGQYSSLKEIFDTVESINNQQSTINNQQSTINNQQSTINNQQSYHYYLRRRYYYCRPCCCYEST